MKNAMFLCFLTILMASLQLSAQDAIFTSQSSEKTSTTLEKSTAIDWDKTEYDYGEIPQGTPAKSTFELTNRGDQPLVITKVKGSCGCTATAHDKEPVLPGQSTVITATYNAKKMGNFHKTVTVTTSASDTPMVLKIKGKVVE